MKISPAKLDKNFYKPQVIFALQNGQFSSEIYFISKNNTFPWTYEYDETYIFMDNFENFLKSNFPTTTILYAKLGQKNKQIKSIKDNYATIVYEVLPGLLIQIYNSEIKNLKNYIIKNKNKELIGEHRIAESINLYFLPNNRAEVDKIIEYIKNNSISFDQKATLLGIISYDDTDYYINYIDITHKLGPFTDLDLHYGDGFSDFYEKVKNLIVNNTKGLVLFHGTPGTGKTYCLRHLIKDLNQRKKFLYMPSSLIEHITEPSFISFLTGEILNSKGQEYIIVIEDAETLLTNRQDSYLTNSVSNILNLSDGLLNDILSVQIIATFNTDLQNIDEALLRKGRLLARKEFIPLDIDRASQLIKKLDLNIEATDQLTLSDLYSQKKSLDYITHGIKPIKKAKLGFIE